MFDDFLALALNFMPSSSWASALIVGLIFAFVAIFVARRIMED